MLQFVRNLLLPDPTGPRLEASRNPAFRKQAKAFLVTHPHCLACGGTTDLEVHHKFPYHLFPELEMDESHWRVLCMHRGRLCHFIFGHCYNWSAWNPYIDKDVEFWRGQVLGSKTDKAGYELYG